MRAADFELELQRDGVEPAAACSFARTLRNFLSRAVGDTRGLRWRVVQLIAPRAAQGIRDVVLFLEEFLERNCGRGTQHGAIDG